MAISKTKFINYTKCPRYCALEKVKKDRLDADVSFLEYKEEEKKANISEILGSIIENSEENDETVLVDKVNRQLEAMMDYYKQVELEAGKISEKTFGGKSKYFEDTKNQEEFDFSLNGIKYLCYVDIYNEDEERINIIEVKATTSKKYTDLKVGNKGGLKYSIWHKRNNIFKLKGEISDYPLEEEMPLKSYEKERQKLFDRYNLGQYVYDLAVQRYFIEHEYIESNNTENLKKFNYYLGVLNANYIFDGTYVDDKPVYNPDKRGNELITFFDMNEITKEYQEIVNQDRIKLEKYLEEMDASACLLGNQCSYKKQNCCKYFNYVCGKEIPKKNSSLDYLHNGFGFVKEDGERIKGLELINQGYMKMMDIPDEWITKRVHEIQRECLVNQSQYIDKEKIKAGLKVIQYPIYHLDFETMPCPVPRFKGEWPYIQSPFEFSLHIEREPGLCDKYQDNIVFLAKTSNDEREDLIKTLLKYVDVNKGTLLAQNVSFEKGRIRELAQIFPEYKEDLLKLEQRGFDLLWLLNTNSKMYMDLGFSEERSKLFNFYDSRLSGSYSIKKTLPVFSNLSYNDLVVKNGTEAIIEYANYNKMSKEELALKQEALAEYCRQDTWAMVEILQSLRNIVK